MSSSADATASRTTASVLGFKPGQTVLELGYDDDVDLDLRDEMEDALDADLEGPDFQEIVDAVVLWWRDDDGDLGDVLVDSLTTLVEGGSVWLITPKAGRDGHVEPSEIQESAELAGMRVTSPMNLAEDWTGTRLVARNH